MQDRQCYSRIVIQGADATQLSRHGALSHKMIRIVGLIRVFAIRSISGRSNVVFDVGPDFRTQMHLRVGA